MKKRLRYRVVSLVVVFCLVAAVFPLFVLPSFAADVSRVNVFTLDWSCSVGALLGGMAKGDIMAGSPFTIHINVVKKGVVSVILDLSEPVFFSNKVYDLSFFLNSVPGTVASISSPAVNINLGADSTFLPTVVSGNSVSGFKSNFTLGSGNGTYPNLKIRFTVSLDVGEYYLTLLDFDPVDDVLVSNGSMFVPYFSFDYDGSGAYPYELAGFSGSASLQNCCTIANNPQFQKFQGNSILKMYGGLNYSFIDGQFWPDFKLSDSSVDSFIRTSDYYYFDISLSLPGTMVYIDVLDEDRSIPFDLAYYATDTVQDVDIAAGTLSQQLTGSTLVPIGGSIAGGLVAVQPTGSHNVNYVLSTNYNAGGTSGNLDYNVDYGYRDTTYLDATTYEYDSTSSFLKASRLNLRFKASASAVQNNVVCINFVCMDNIYVNYERTFTEAGLLNYNSNDRYFDASVVVSNAVTDSLVSFDTEYLANKMDKNTDDVLAFLERFYPSSKSIVEFNSTLSDLNTSRDTVDGYQAQMQNNLSTDFKRLPTFDNSVSSYSNAMIFVSTVANDVASSMTGFTGIIVIPILLGLFFFILQRASGVTRIGRNSRHSDGSDKGGGSS